ncbi:basic leucine zipper transcriptional factor ATF-like 3 [Cimex lectularius]|uniref:BZIP domain-containing protein n=1 Tax=Cimex lectularius TaxID=79782 RepID=A0A8I6TGL6_CIMLE|nr:basic leucine zipper transcriptional factor ATF-like 3 [Cimex lectularius]
MFSLNESMFSALHLLRSYNQYIGPVSDSEVQVSQEVGRDGLVNPLVSTPLFLPPPPYPYTSPPILSLPQTDIKSALRTVGSPRRPRSEKKPIPVEQKDEKYYERRKRNNQAAKKSRDARRLREDHIALRASMLEHENAVLRAQVITLREEAQSLRQLLLHHKMSEPHEICSLK